MALDEDEQQAIYLSYLRHGPHNARGLQRVADHLLGEVEDYKTKAALVLLASAARTIREVLPDERGEHAHFRVERDDDGYASVSLRRITGTDPGDIVYDSLDVMGWYYEAHPEGDLPDHEMLVARAFDVFRGRRRPPGLTETIAWTEYSLLIR